MKTNPDKDVELRAKINMETSRLPWSELQRHFAAGTVVYVSNELDLIDVAVRISHDDKASVTRWMQQGQLAKVTDQQAAAWLAANAALWTSVISPFVLVQQDKPRQH